MQVDILYRTKRGNQDHSAAVLVKGATASIQVYGSQSIPTSLADMVDLSDGATTINEGAWPFIILPEYVYFTGTADSIEQVGFNVEDLGAFVGD